MILNADNDHTKRVITITNDWLASLLVGYSDVIPEINNLAFYKWHPDYRDGIASAITLFSDTLTGFDSVVACLTHYGGDVSVLTSANIDTDLLLGEIEKISNWDSMIMDSMEFDTIPDTIPDRYVLSVDSEFFVLSKNGEPIWSQSEEDRFDVANWMKTPTDIQGLCDALITYTVLPVDLEGFETEL